MSQSGVSTRCECEATLGASLDEKRHVLSGWATHRGDRERAPAHSIHADNDRFDIGWLCPFCNRNTLRTFHVGAIHTL